MKKFLVSVIAVSLLAGGLSACGKKGKPKYKAFEPGQSRSIDRV